MELGSAHGHHINRKQQHGNQLTKGSEQQCEDGKSDDKKKGEGKKSAADLKPIAALVNSNMQSVNNSILLRSSCTQQSPASTSLLSASDNPNTKAPPIERLPTAANQWQSLPALLRTK